jgi:hypothetical protein
MTDHDLDWLVAERPEPIVLDDVATERAREALHMHMDGRRPVGAAGPVRSGAGRRLVSRRRTRRWIVRLTPLAATGAAALAAVILTSTSPVGHPAPSRVAAAHPATSSLPRSPLVQLAGYIWHQRRLRGDATLVLRTQSYPNQPPITGADLYTDSGKYFYAPTLSGLPTSIAQNDNVSSNGFLDRELEAARLAANGNVQTARTDMANASWGPGYTPPTQAQIERQLKRALGRGNLPTPVRTVERQRLRMIEQSKSIGPQARADNMVWVNSLDALAEGAGDPLVRAGVLRLLSTVNTVNVAHTTFDGQPALTITASGEALPADYQEQLIINADTGVPLRFAGGAPGQTPGVTVTYRVFRVTVAKIAAGQFGRAGN